MADYYVWSGSGVVEYSARAWALGDRMVIPQANTSTNYRVAKSVVWECTTAGTTTTTSLTLPGTVTRNVTTFTIDGVVFTARQPGFSSAGVIDWNYAYPNLIPLIERTGDGGIQGGDFIFMASDHNGVHSMISNQQISGPTPGNPLYVLSVQRTTGIRPTVLEVGATETSTQSTGGSHWAHFSGIVFGLTVKATGAMGMTSFGQIDNGHLEMRSCRMEFGAAAPTMAMSIGSGATNIEGRVTFRDCWFKFGNSTATNTGINLLWGAITLIGGGIDPAGVSPKQFIYNAGIGSYGATFDGFDFSHLASDGFVTRLWGDNSSGKIVLRNCKTPASWTGGLAPSTQPTSEGAALEAIHSGPNASGMSYSSTQRGGVTNTTTAIFRDGYPSEAGTAHSIRVVTNSLCGRLAPVRLPEMAPQPLTAGVPVTVSVDLLTDNVTLTDAQAWIEGLAMTTSGSPLGVPVTTQMVDPLATPATIPTSTETWTSPGITTPVKQKLSLTFTPAVSGWAYFRVHIARASTTVYVDPVLRVA